MEIIPLHSAAALHPEVTSKKPDMTAVTNWGSMCKDCARIVNTPNASIIPRITANTTTKAHNIIIAEALSVTAFTKARLIGVAEGFIGR